MSPLKERTPLLGGDDDEFELTRANQASAYAWWSSLVLAARRAGCSTAPLKNHDPLAAPATTNPFVDDDELESELDLPRMPRTRSLLGLAATIFLAGFGWEASALLIGGDSTQTFRFSALTGLGECLGVLMGSSVALLQGCCKEWPALRKQLCGSLASGMAFSPLYNLIHVYFKLPFWCTAPLVGLLGGAAFLVGLVVGGSCGPRPAESVDRPWRADVSLAIAVAGAQACFVLTEAGFTQKGDPLLYFAAKADDRWVFNALKAGTTTLVGFAITQTLLNACAPRGALWADGEAQTPKANLFI